MSDERNDQSRMFKLTIHACLVLMLFCTVRVRSLAATAPESDSFKTGRYTLEQPGLNREIGKLLAGRIGIALNAATQGPSPKRGAGHKKEPAAEPPKTNDGSEPAKWEVYVPAKATRGQLMGLFVFINSGKDGSVPENYLPVLDERSLAWVSPAGAENGQEILLRCWLAMEGATCLRQRYSIDPARIYVGGVSGGGRVASRLAIFCPDSFVGGYFFCGVDYYRNLPAGNGFKPGFWTRPNPMLLQTARSQGRYVLCTGSKDFNNQDTKTTFDGFRQDRFVYAKLQEIDGMGHGLPSANDFEKGIELLDAPLALGAKGQYQKAQSLLKRKKLGDAWLAFGQAASHGTGEEFAQESQTQADRLYKQYEQSLAEVRSLVDNGDPKARSALAELKTQYGPLAQQDVAQLAEQRKKPARKDP